MPSYIDPLFGLCRCKKHAQKFQPRTNINKSRFYIPEELVPEELLCGACLQAGTPSHGGLIVSEDSLENNVVAFRAHAALTISDDQIKAAKKIWPR